MSRLEDEEFILNRRKAQEQKAREDLVDAAKRYEEFGFRVEIIVHETRK